jgi:hypothetical protein
MSRSRHDIEVTLEQAAAEPLHAPDPEFVNRLGARLHRIAAGEEPAPRAARPPVRRRLPRREPLLVFGFVGAMATAAFAVAAAIPDSGPGTRGNTGTLSAPTVTTTFAPAEPAPTVATTVPVHPERPSTTPATTTAPVTTPPVTAPPVTAPPATHEVTTTLAPIDIQLAVSCSPGVIDTQIAVTCTWQATGSQAGQITEFHILRGQPGAPGRVFTAPGTATSYVDRPLTAATSYSYLVQAVIWGKVVVQTPATVTTP